MGPIRTSLNNYFFEGIVFFGWASCKKLALALLFGYFWAS